MPKLNKNQEKINISHEIMKLISEAKSSDTSVEELFNLVVIIGLEDSTHAMKGLVKSSRVNIEYDLKAKPPEPGEFYSKDDINTIKRMMEKTPGFNDGTATSTAFNLAGLVAFIYSNTGLKQELKKLEIRNKYYDVTISYSPLIGIDKIPDIPLPSKKPKLMIDDSKTPLNQKMVIDNGSSELEYIGRFSDESEKIVYFKRSTEDSVIEIENSFNISSMMIFKLLNEKSGLLESPNFILSINGVIIGVDKARLLKTRYEFIVFYR